MKVKELLAFLANEDPEATVVVSGFETVATNYVAEVNLIATCVTVETKPDAMSGDRRIEVGGQPTIWLGWKGDYRTQSLLEAIADPTHFD